MQLVKLSISIQDRILSKPSMIETRCRFYRSLLRCVLVIIASSSFHFLYAQESSQTDISISSLATLSGEGAPFWFESNNYGLYASDDIYSGNYFVLINKTYYKSFEFNSKFSTMGRLSTNSSLFFHELFIEAKYRQFTLFVGKKEWRDGFAITDLGFGSMIWSSNSATVPKITLQVKDWQKVPFTGGLFSYKGYYSHGWFEEDRFVESSYLHEKALYLYLGKDNWPIKFLGAIIHNVMWAGEHPSFGNLPDKLDDYISIVTFQKGSDDPDNPEPISFQGSTVGAFDFGIHYQFLKSEVQLSKQFYLESRTSTYFRSPADGLWRLEWKKSNQQNAGITAFSYEVLNMIKQDSQRNEGETRGGDQSYFNFIYNDGWSYKNRIIGIPLVQTTYINDILFISNNIFLSHNVSMRVRPWFISNDNPTYLETKFTYSRSYGRTTNCPSNFCTSGLDRPYRSDRQDQYSVYLMAKFPIKKDLLITTATALDVGDLYDSIGFRIGITYNLQSILK